MGTSCAPSLPLTPCNPIHRRRLVVSSIVRVLVAPRQLHSSFGLVSAWSLPLSRWRPARAAVPRSYVGVPQLGRGAPWHSGHLAGLLHSGADFTWRPASGQLCSQSVKQAGGRQEEAGGGAGGGRRRQEEAGGLTAHERLHLNVVLGEAPEARSSVMVVSGAW